MSEQSARLRRGVARARETVRQTAYRPSVLAKRWDVSTPLIYRLLNSGGIVGFKVGGSWRISEEEVQRIEALPVDNLEKIVADDDEDSFPNPLL